MERKTRTMTIILGIVILGISSVIFVKNFVKKNWVQHIFHLSSPPKDLYEPIVNGNFLFYKKGFTKTYSLKPKYIDTYDVGFLIEKKNLPSKYKFKGKIKAEFFYKNKLLFERDIISIKAAVYADKKMKYLKSISLLSFDIPLNGKYEDDISVRLTVLEPDENLKEYGDSIQLFIKVSSIP